MRDELVWIDCEMTGLDLGSDRLIEIAALVTDSELNVLGDGVDVVIHADEEASGSMVEIVRGCTTSPDLPTRFGRHRSTASPRPKTGR